MDHFPLSNKYENEEKILSALPNADKLQEAIFKATELCIISILPDGTITSLNHKTEILSGYSAKETVGKISIIQFFDEEELHHRSRELTRELLRNVKSGVDALIAKPTQTKITEQKDWTFIKKDGSLLNVLLSVTPMWDENQNVTGYACLVTDITAIKKSETKIRNAEAHLHTVISSLEDLVVETDMNGSHVTQWTGNVFHEGRKNIQDIFGEDLAVKFLAITRRVLATGKTEFLEYQTPENLHWHNARFSWLTDERVLICIRDITEKKQAELALKKSESKFRILAENIPGIIYLCRNDEVYSMLYLNEKVYELTGYTEKEFISGAINFVQLYHPDDKESIFVKVDEALANKKNFQLSYRLRHKSGEWRWVDEMGVGVYHENTLLMIEGFIIDVTLQKRAEEKLQKIADENYWLFNNAVTLTAIAGYDGFFKKVNPSWSKILGWSEAELLARPFIEFVHPDDVEATKNFSRHISRGSHTEIFENRYQCSDGSYRWLLWTAASDAPSKLIYATALDITDRKINEEELLRSKQSLEIAAESLMEQNRLLDEFAHIISHNLRSPIGNIRALIGLLNQYSSMEDYSMVFEKLNNLSKNLAETMNDLMDTLKVKTNTDIQKTEIRFKELLDKVIQSLEGEMIHAGATITYNFNAAPKVWFVRAYLESIFQNLLTNAIKYRSHERTPVIHLETSVADNRIQLRVTDNGLGIDLEKFGDKLFGLHKTFHEHKEAKGVGLFLTKTQIETLNGSITVESKVNKGTTFIITF